MKPGSSHDSTPLLAEKRKTKKELREINKNRKEVEMELNSSIISKASIFENSSDSESERASVINLDSFDSDVNLKDDNNKQEVEDPDKKDNNEDKNDKRKIMKKKSTSKTSSECHFCLPFNQGKHIYFKINF